MVIVAPTLSGEGVVIDEVSLPVVLRGPVVVVVVAIVVAAVVVVVVVVVVVATITTNNLLPLLHCSSTGRSTTKQTTITVDVPMLSCYGLHFLRILQAPYQLLVTNHPMPMLHRTKW